MGEATRSCGVPSRAGTAATGRSGRPRASEFSRLRPRRSFAARPGAAWPASAPDVFFDAPGASSRRSAGPSGPAPRDAPEPRTGVPRSEARPCARVRVDVRVRLPELRTARPFRSRSLHRSALGHRRRVNDSKSGRHLRVRQIILYFSVNYRRMKRHAASRGNYSTPPVRIKLVGFSGIGSRQVRTTPIEPPRQDARAAGEAAKSR